MKKNSILIILIICLVFSVHAAKAETDYSINGSILSSGGGNISGTDYDTDIALSQITGNTSSTNFEAQFGFFYAIKSNPPTCDTIPDQIWNQNTSATLNLAEYTSDMDNDDLTYSNTTVEDIGISINQETGMATLTPKSGFLGTRTVIFSVRDYTETIDCNSITLTVVVPPYQEPTAGGEVSPGAGGAITPTIRREFTIDKDLFHIKLMQGESKRELLDVKNIADEKLEFVVDIGDLKKFVIVDDPAFELEEDEMKTLKFDFFAGEKEFPDVYTGRITITADGIEKTINTIIDVMSKEALFDVFLKVYPEDKEIEKEQTVRANITILNLGDLREVDVTIDYIIKDMKGDVIDKKSETIAIMGEELSFTKEFDTRSLKPEDYVVYVRLTYLEAVATSSELFTVTGIEVPFLKSIFPFIIAILILTILIVLIIIGIKKEGMKRLVEYFRSVKYKLLNREFVEDAKTKLLAKGWKEKHVEKALEKATS